MAPVVRELAKFKKSDSQLGKRKGGHCPWDEGSLLRSTEKAANAKLAYQARAEACHGRTVREVVASMSEPGSTYRMADLRYDIKQGRLEVLKPGVGSGPLPAGKDREPAPLAGRPLPAATLGDFFKFLQGQLRKEAIEHTGTDVELTDPGAKEMWPHVEAFVAPNLGNTERWVPYHTVLGVHELFLVQHVHRRSEWSEKQKFQAVFVFRAHCKRDLFTKAQLPLMQEKDFWQDPVKAFRPNGPMERSILEYRKRTSEPLLTSCFRIIPPRVLKDDTENLVRSITHRTQSLLGLAEETFPILKDKKLSPAEKICKISDKISSTEGCGNTWAKMLTGCIDLAYPKERFLEAQCDVGTGAAPALKCLLPKDVPADRKEALQALLKIVNDANGTHAKHFWAILSDNEKIIRTKFKDFPLVCEQANTKRGGITAFTLQVQLCEYRQFRHSIARLQYGLPHDASMIEEEFRKPEPQDFMRFDQKTNSVTFELPDSDGRKIPFAVSVKASKCQLVAKRVALICFMKMRDGGGSKAEAEKLRDWLLDGYEHGEDVPASSPSWHECRIGLGHSSPQVAWRIETKSGGSFAFQTTKDAAGGCLQAERIGRLCWEKLSAGVGQDAVREYRNKLYKQARPNGFKPGSDAMAKAIFRPRTDSGPPSKKRRLAK